MDYAQALPLYGLRQNVFTDPQKPMKVEPGIYPLNGGDENSVCLTTVDFALTYFVVSGELERSGVPCNLIINDAGGLSVLTCLGSRKASLLPLLPSSFRRTILPERSRTSTLITARKGSSSEGRYRGKAAGLESHRRPRLRQYSWLSS